MDFTFRPFQKLKFGHKIGELRDATNILRDALSDLNGTVTAQISGGRGDYKTLLARDLCYFVRDKKGYSFSVDNVFFNNSQIDAFLKSVEDVDEVKAVLMRDEFGQILGQMSVTGIAHTRTTLEAIRIKKVDVFVVNPDERGQGELKFDLQLSPVAFDFKKKEHLVIFSLPDINELYLATMPSWYMTDEAEAFYKLYLLKKKQYIKDIQNFKVDKTKMYIDIMNEIFEKLPDKFTKKTYKAYARLSGYNLSEAEDDLVFEFLMMKKKGLSLKNE